MEARDEPAVCRLPRAGRYVTLQRNLADPSRYRCSTGLVVDAVRKAGHEAPALILGESEPATRALLEKQLAREALISCLDETVPDIESLHWVYFATPRKADRDTTYDLAYRYGIICCDVWKKGGMQRMPNVKQTTPGHVMLLVYGEHGKYQPQLYLRIEGPTGRTIEDTHVMHELPAELAPVLANAGYGPDPVEGTFTGFRVTPCSDWKDKIQSTLRKPTGQNFLRRWDEVCRENGWDVDGHR